MNLQVAQPMPLPALAIPFRVTPTRVSLIAVTDEDTHRRLAPPNWRGASEEQGI
jgi:hypothetical protein